MKTTPHIILALATSLIALPATAQDSGFLSDYSLLQTREGDAAVERVYIKEGIMERLLDYNAVMVDQPEVYLSEDTKDKYGKPDALMQLASTMRYAMMERLEAGGYNVTDEPGQGVLFMRWAVTDLYLKKKKRGILSYTPLGAVVHATHQASIKDLWKKIDIVEMTIELELLDSVTEEILAAAVDSSGQRKDKKADLEQVTVTWEELDAQMRTVGERIRCQLDNARRAEGDRENCAAILIEPEYPEED
jgi:hypothetical protein